MTQQITLLFFNLSPESPPNSPASPCRSVRAPGRCISHSECRSAPGIHGKILGIGREPILGPRFEGRKGTALQTVTNSFVIRTHSSFEMKYFGTLACNAEKCWDVFCSFLLQQSAPSFNAQLGQWHLKLSCIDEVGQRSISTIDKPSIGHSYGLWRLVTFMSHQNHTSPAWDPDATVKKVCLVPVWFTVHLPYICIPCTWYNYHDTFCIVLLCVRASSIGIQWPSPNVNSLKWLWIKSWHRRLFDAETKTRASRAALLSRGTLA